ncbi:MAG TPA: winged helix-turn-helix domain-containing protein [Thermoanaerobaculia bacterium]|jgi:DNA-binding winged helix-turn-helix (wHTH) protein/Flp pilus assembly protein TadD|nr:winged helix-turn-helix domain-containing protein [Thermoanaerobaculia bacterium]
MQRERYRIADLTIDVEAVSVLREDGVALPLPRLSFDLLVALARRAPDVVRSEELIATVWAGVAVSDETLTQRVALLRRALGDEAKNPRYLRVVRGRGYQLVPEAVVPSSEHRPAQPARAAVAVLIVVFFVLLALFLVFFRAQSPPPVATRSPSVPELLQRAGSYLGQHQASNNELAIELYQRALRMQPANAQAMAGLSLALGQRATKFNQHGDAGDQALALARKALALDPRLGQAHHALGLALDSKGMVTPALAAYRRAAELEPQPANALASAANLLMVQGHLAEALEMNVRVARSGGDTPTYLEVQMGQILALLGYKPAAAVWFERALELRPDNVFAAASYAQMRLSQGRLREAEEIAAQAVRHGVRRPELAEIRGTVAFLQGGTSRAKALYEEALAIAPGFSRARTRLLLLGSTDLQRRQWLEELRRGRAEGDEWPDAALDEALLETGAGHPEAALQALDVAIGQGYRDEDWLLRDPMLAGLRTPDLQRRIETIRRLVGFERQRVLGAGWLPPSLLDGRAARM